MSVCQVVDSIAMIPALVVPVNTVSVGSENLVIQFFRLPCIQPRFGDIDVVCIEILGGFLGLCFGLSAIFSSAH